METIATMVVVLWKKQNKCLSLWNTLNNDFSIQIQDVFNTSLKDLGLIVSVKHSFLFCYFMKILWSKTMPWIFFLPQENKETAWNPWTPSLLNRWKRVDLLLKLDYAQVLIFKQTLNFLLCFSHISFSIFFFLLLCVSSFLFILVVTVFET